MQELTLTPIIKLLTRELMRQLYTNEWQPRYNPTQPHPHTNTPPTKTTRKPIYYTLTAHYQGNETTHPTPLILTSPAFRKARAWAFANNLICHKCTRHHNHYRQCTKNKCSFSQYTNNFAHYLYIKNRNQYILNKTHGYTHKHEKLAQLILKQIHHKYTNTET